MERELYLGRSLSLAGFARLGDQISVFGRARLGAGLSVLEVSSFGSSLSVQYFVKFGGELLSVIGQVQAVSTVFILDRASLEASLLSVSSFASICSDVSTFGNSQLGSGASFLGLAHRDIGRWIGFHRWFVFSPVPVYSRWALLFRSLWQPRPVAAFQC